MDNNVGTKIRYLRKMKKATLADMAQATGLSIGYLSNVERSQCSPTLENIQRICLFLDIPLVDLFSDNVGPQLIVTPADREVTFEQADRVRYEAINFGMKTLDGLIIHLEPHCEFDEEWTHDFDEIGLVLEGELTVVLDGNVHTLHEGDAIYIDAMKNHSVNNTSDGSCVSYWVKQTGM